MERGNRREMHSDSKRRIGAKNRGEKENEQVKDGLNLEMERNV